MKSSAPTLTLATYVTLMRIACIPFIFLSMVYSAWGSLTTLFVLASITDIVDGFIARTYNQISWLGTILDPLADKILLITVYAGLSYSNLIAVALPLWFVGFVILHELLLVAGVSYFSLIKQKIQIRPSWLAKLLGFGQFLFIFWVLLSGYVGRIPLFLFYVVLFLITLGRLCVLIEYAATLQKALEQV